MPPKHKDTKTHAEILRTQAQRPLETRPINRSTEPAIKPLASELPCDILFQIFGQYLVTETTTHPVETLLLVCKSWAQAALEDCHLWSKFSILLKDLAFWSSTLPRRLRRCPRTTLLDLNINLMGFIGIYAGSRRHDALVIFESYHEAIFLALTGLQGETALRWRKVVLRDDYSGSRDRDFTESKIAKFLCYPTPNLQELNLREFQSPLRIFPLTPMLKVFSAYNVVLPSFPDLSFASEVSICIDGNFQDAIADAVSVVKLRLFPGKAYGYYLSNSYPHLTSLHLIYGLRWQKLEGFSAPALQDISLHFETGTEFATVVSCKGIPLHKIREVSLQTRDRAKDNDLEFYRDELLLFLKAVTQVKVLKGIGYVSDALLVHLLESEPLYPDHAVLLKLSKCSVEVGSGKDRISSMKETRRRYEGLPSGTWDEVQERLDDWIC